jgi:hypothetical protein
LHASSPVLPVLCTRAPEPFRRCEPDWAACVMELLAMAESRLGA